MCNILVEDLEQFVAKHSSLSVLAQAIDSAMIYILFPLLLNHLSHKLTR